MTRKRVPASTSPAGDKPFCDTLSHYADEPRASTLPIARTTKSVAALHAAFLRLLDRQSLEEITVDAIAREACVHRATFFRQFSTQRALLDDVAGEQIEALSALTVSILRDRDGRAAATALFAYVEDHRNLWSALLSGAEGAMRVRLNAYSLEIASAKLGDPGDTIISLCVRLSSSIIIDCLGWFLSRPPGTTSKNELAAIVDGLLANVQTIQETYDVHLQDRDMAR